MVADVPLLVLVEAILVVEVLLVIEVTKVVVMLFVVTTAAGVHWANPKVEGPRQTLTPELVVLRIRGKVYLQEFCVLQVALATQTVDPVQPIPPPEN